MNMQAMPPWLPARKVKPSDITPVAWFVYDFELLVARCGAQVSSDPTGGGAGPVRFFFLSLGGSRIAEFSSWARKPGYVELSLLVDDNGVVWWEDYEAVMAPLQVPLEEVRRQGAFEWRRRSPPGGGSSSD